MSNANQVLIQDFESGAIRNEAFHHADHVRLAFAYLSQHPPLDSLDRFTAALKRFAIANGKPQLYHETITYAYFFLIRERMARCDETSWEAFAAKNRDLLIWKDGILTRYYRDETLKSDFARSTFVFPDKHC